MCGSWNIQHKMSCSITSSGRGVCRWGGGLLLLAGGVVVVLLLQADAATPLLPPLSVSCHLPAAQLHTDHRRCRFPIFNVFSSCRVQVFATAHTSNTSSTSSHVSFVASCRLIAHLQYLLGLCCVCVCVFGVEFDRRSFVFELKRKFF